VKEMDKSPLVSKKCEPCSGIGQALTKAEAEPFMKRVSGWALGAEGKSISQSYVLRDFMAAVKLVELIAAIAEADDHHPDFHLTGYRNLRVDLSTHKLDGLTRNDFIVAAKIDQLDKDLKSTD